MAEDAAPSEVEFLSALDDAYIRLACVQSAVTLHPNERTDAILENARTIYNWVMDCQPDDDVTDPDELTATTSEAQCTRKH
jgi:hypothetical protein